MGALVARFRKKESTIEILEGIEKDITKLQKFRQENQERQKKFIGRLILYSILIYIIAAVIFYFYYFPTDWKNRALYSLPLLIFPLLIWLIKKTLHWYYVKRITKNDLALNELREKRKQILEDVMEKETYKKAREILQKFDPARFKELETPAQTKSASSPGLTVRQRTNIPSAKVTPRTQVRPVTPYQRPPGSSPVYRPTSPKPGSTPNIRHQGQIHPRMLMNPQHNGRTPGPPLPRTILPRERSKTDRLLEYLVGDGPQNRYALICKYCHSHNGMALKEEFEYLSFRCCYCYQVNASKKQRPYAPKLDIPAATPTASGIPRPAREVNEESDDDDDDDDDEEDDDEEEDKENGEKSDSSPDNKSGEIDNTDKPVPIATVTKEGAAAMITGSHQQKNGEDKYIDKISESDTIRETDGQSTSQRPGGDCEKQKEQ